MKFKKTLMSFLTLSSLMSNSVLANQQKIVPFTLNDVKKSSVEVRINLKDGIYSYGSGNVYSSKDNRDFVLISAGHVVEDSNYSEEPGKLINLLKGGKTIAKFENIYCNSGFIEPTFPIEEQVDFAYCKIPKNKFIKGSKFKRPNSWNTNYSYNGIVLSTKFNSAQKLPLNTGGVVPNDPSGVLKFPTLKFQIGTGYSLKTITRKGMSGGNLFFHSPVLGYIPVGVASSNNENYKYVAHFDGNVNKIFNGRGVQLPKPDERWILDLIETGVYELPY